MEPEQENTRRSGHILVVEDNVHLSELITTCLEEFEHSFLAVPSGEAALKAVEEHIFDVILMDIKMPGLDGMETTRLIRAGNSKAQYIAIIALTASTQDVDREQFVQAGMNGFLPKPFDAEHLFRMIDTALEAQQQTTE